MISIYFLHYSAYLSVFRGWYSYICVKMKIFKSRTAQIDAEGREEGTNYGDRSKWLVYISYIFPRNSAFSAVDILIFVWRWRFLNRGRRGLTRKEGRKELIMLKDVNGYSYLSYILPRTSAFSAVDSLIFVWRVKIFNRGMRGLTRK